MKQVVALLVLAGFMMGVVHTSNAMPCAAKTAFSDKFTQYSGSTSNGTTMAASCDPIDVLAAAIALVALAKHLWDSCVQDTPSAAVLKAHSDSLFDLPAHG